MCTGSVALEAQGLDDRRARMDSPKREAILDAALELFAVRGFHGTAVPLVASKAGVGAGTVYRYFESKEALVNALYARWKSELGTALLSAFVPGAPTREQFHAVWEATGRFAQEHPKAIAFLELHHHGSYLDEESRALTERVLRPIEQVITCAQKAQVFKDYPAPLIIALVWGAFVGVVRSSWDGHLTLEAETLEQAERCVWEAIRR